MSGRRTIGQVSQRFVSRMRGLRAHHDLTAAQLAQRCADLGASEINRSAIARIETQARGVSLDEAAWIAEALGVSLAQMTTPEPLTVEIKVELP